MPLQVDNHLQQACHSFALCFVPKTKKKKTNMSGILAEETAGHVWNWKKDASDLLVCSFSLAIVGLSLVAALTHMTRIVLTPHT